MKEFDLDLLINKKAVVNCRTKEEEAEFLKYLKYKGIRWCNNTDVFENKEYCFEHYMGNTCFSLEDEDGKYLGYSNKDYFEERDYQILSLTDLVIAQEEKPLNNFKDYGFEAEFEGEIFSQYQDEFYGVIYRENGNNWVVIWSSKSGKCYNNDGVDIKKYNLKPIKKEWYENPDNFPCIIKQINCIDDVILDGDFLILKNINDYHKYGGDYRFPTEKEILKLLVKE